MTRFQIQNKLIWLQLKKVKKTSFLLIQFKQLNQIMRIIKSSLFMHLLKIVKNQMKLIQLLQMLILEF